MVNPARKKARITSVGEKGKEKADTFPEHEESDHAGSLFSGSDGRSSPDVSLATKGKCNVLCRSHRADMNR